jgi:hypothetical protein
MLDRKAKTGTERALSSQTPPTALRAHLSLVGALAFAWSKHSIHLA